MLKLSNFSLNTEDPRVSDEGQLGHLIASHCAADLQALQVMRTGVMDFAHRQVFF